MNQENCLGCQRCESGPVVTLHDGCVVCNYCADYRDECLARHIMSLPTKQDRREYLDQWQKHHGKQSADRLGEMIKAMWASRPGRQ